MAEEKVPLVVLESIEVLSYLAVFLAFELYGDIDQ